jgi:hypothetical protein
MSGPDVICRRSISPLIPAKAGIQFFLFWPWTRFRGGARNEILALLSDREGSLRVTVFNPFAWTRRQQELVDRTAAWVADRRSDALLLTAQQLADVDFWLGASAAMYPGIDQDVLQYLASSRDKLKNGGTP